MCLCFCFVWARGFCPSFLCAILLPVYWYIFPSCSPSLPSSFAPIIISLCLQFRVGSLPYVGSSSMSCVLPCPALPSLIQPCPACQSVFPLRGCFCLFYLLFINKKPIFLVHLGPRSLPSTQTDKSWLNVIYGLLVPAPRNINTHSEKKAQKLSSEWYLLK